MYPICEECTTPDPDDEVVGCSDGVFRCQNCCIEDGFSPFTGERDSDDENQN